MGSHSIYYLPHSRSHLYPARQAGTQFQRARLSWPGWFGYIPRWCTQPKTHHCAIQARPRVISLVQWKTLPQCQMRVNRKWSVLCDTYIPMWILWSPLHLYMPYTYPLSHTRLSPCRYLDELLLPDQLTAHLHYSLFLHQTILLLCLINSVELSTKWCSL